MTIKRVLLFLSFFIFVIIVSATITLAASSNFLPKANEFYKNNCEGWERPPNPNGAICYLIDKTRELDLEIIGLKSRLDTNGTLDATQSAQIAELESRIAALESNPPLPSCVQLPAGILSWWPGDSNANDIIGNNNGTLNNGASFASGMVGQTFSFDGQDDYVQASTNNLPTGNNNRTLELWVKINAFLEDVPNPSSPNETFFAGYGNFGSGGQSYQLGTAGNVLYFSSWGGAIFGPSLQTNRWYHIAVKNVGDAATLYLDGSVVASGNMSINTPGNTNFYIGKAPDPYGSIRRLNGLVDEATVYNRALSDSEIKSISDAGSNGKCKQTTSPTVLFNDDFNGTTLDTNKWESFNTDGGNYSFSNGSIVVPGGSSMFYIRSKNNPFPISGPFEVEFGIQYTVVQPSGIGVALGFEQQNGYDPTNIPVSYWQDSASGLNVSRFGLNVASLGGNPETNYHVGKIVYDGTLYKVLVDGVLKYTSPPSATAKSLWFGNPFCCRTNWTGFNLDYIKVTAI